MSSSSANERGGRVASLHLPPGQTGALLVSRDSLEGVAERGISGDPRYLGRPNQSTGRPNRRQITLIEREQIAEHAVSPGRESIPPGAVWSNIETTGIPLVTLVGQRNRIGEAILAVYEAHTPCAKMDELRQGLRSLMEAGKRGVPTEVLQSGCIQVGDSIHALDTSVEAQERGSEP